MFIQSLPIYNSKVWDHMYDQIESLKKNSSFNELFFYSFGISNPNIEGIRLSYWDEIKMISNFWEMLDEVVKQNKELIKENEDFHIDQLFMDKQYLDISQRNPIIRYYIDLELTQKYKTLLFEKINIIMIILEELEENDEKLENDEQKDFMETNYIELSSFYDNIHEKFYNKFLN